jgi:hypothetical protein
MLPTIRRFATRPPARCAQYQHQGVVAVFLDKPLKLRCAKCGSGDPIIVQRDRTRTWEARRRGSGAERN